SGPRRSPRCTRSIGGRPRTPPSGSKALRGRRGRTPASCHRRRLPYRRSGWTEENGLDARLLARRGDEFVEVDLFFHQEVETVGDIAFFPDEFFILRLGREVSDQNAANYFPVLEREPSPLLVAELRFHRIVAEGWMTKGEEGKVEVRGRIGRYPAELGFLAIGRHVLAGDRPVFGRTATGPVLGVLAEEGGVKAGEVARGVNVVDGGLHVRVDYDALVAFDIGAVEDFEVEVQPASDPHEVGVVGLAIGSDGGG